jgi:hypothetical protein
LAFDGDVAMKCEGVARGCPHQQVRVKPGHYGAAAFVKIPDDHSGKGWLGIRMAYINENGQINGYGAGARIEKIEPGAWFPIGCAGELPAEDEGEPVAGIDLLLLVYENEPGDRVYFDDASLFRLD